MKLFLAILISFSCFGSQEEALQALKEIHGGMDLVQISELTGKGELDGQGNTVWNKKSYVLTYFANKKIAVLKPKNELHLKELPFSEFTIEGELSKGDLNEGRIVSVPERGLYFTASPNGSIKEVYFKEGMGSEKGKNKKKTKDETLELLTSPKVAK